MKKLLSILLAAAMAFSLAACGDSGTGGGKLPSAQSGGNGSALSTDFQQHMKRRTGFSLALCVKRKRAGISSITICSTTLTRNLSKRRYCAESRIANMLIPPVMLG